MANSAEDICPRCKTNELCIGEKICEQCRKIERDRVRKKNIARNIEGELRKRGVRGKYLRCSFENFRITAPGVGGVVERLRGLDPGVNKSTFISSAMSGTGKTHLAVATLREVLLGGCENSLFISSPWLFLDIKHAYEKKDDVSEERVITKYCSFDFLVIDDIGAEMISPWALQLWYMIIDRRDADEKSTLYTSNLDMGQVADSMGPRIASRIGSGDLYTLPGKDYRIEGKRVVR